MLRRDYLLRLIQDLFAAISQLFHDDMDVDEKRRRIEALYTEFGESATFFRSATTSEAVATVARVAADSQGVKPDQLTASEMEQRLDLLAALMYADSQNELLPFQLRRDVAERAIALTLMVNKTSDTYSIERLNRIDDLRKFISEGDCSI